MPEAQDGQLEKYKIIGDLIVRVGVVSVVLGAVLWFHFHEFSVFRRAMNWNMQRSIRNERAMMQKMGIALVLDGNKSDD